MTVDMIEQHASFRFFNESFSDKSGTVSISPEFSVTFTVSLIYLAFIINVWNEIFKKTDKKDSTRV